VLADNVWTVLGPVSEAIRGAPQEGPRPMIELRDVQNSHERQRALTIPHPLSMTIARGRFPPLVGPSGEIDAARSDRGAGRRPGSVLIDGVDITRLGEIGEAPAAGDRLVFQFFHLIRRSAVENGPCRWGTSASAMRGSGRRRCWKRSA
jgi:predicted ABC-type transport system involved in lysophospholipase L1 biosynthesis ATPase subunit